jgi:hypothetical protein
MGCRPPFAKTSLPQRLGRQVPEANDDQQRPSIEKCAQYFDRQRAPKRQMAARLMRIDIDAQAGQR